MGGGRSRRGLSATRPMPGVKITAGNQYMRAGNYYYSAERFIPPGEEKLAIYRKALRCYQGAMARLHPDIERVEVPYEKGQTLPACFVKGRGHGQRPTVVLFDGMDNAKEMSVIFAGLDLAKRGINVLAIDGPGQSEPLRLRNIPSRHDYEAAGIPAYDYVAARPEVDPKRVAVMGYSFGGYHAPRICAFDKRYAAGVAFGAMHWSIYDFVKGHAPTDPRANLGLDFPVPLGGRRARQRDRAGMGEEIHARRRRPESRLPVPDPARRERPRRAARRRQRNSTRGSAPRKDCKIFTDEPKAAPNIARSTTGSLASTSSATGCRKMRLAHRSAERRTVDPERSEPHWAVSEELMIKFVRALAIVAPLLAAGQPAPAQTHYPDRPIHLIIAFVPGGATDTLRAADLQRSAGCARPAGGHREPPGAGGYLAWNHVASSDPDGYTLLLAENAVAISQALYKKSKSNFDPITQYDAVAGLAASPSALVVANNVPVKTVADCSPIRSTVPQKINFASAGVGTVSHLNFEVFMDKHRHGGRACALQGRRPGDRRRDRRPRADDHLLGAGGQGPGRERQGPWRSP